MLKLGVKNSIIYFDIDRTLIDAVKIRENTRTEIARESGLSREKVEEYINEYVSTLAHKNGYSYMEMLKHLSLKSGINFEILKQAHDKPANFSDSLYDDTILTLTKLKENNNILGIYSEGWDDYQLNKLKLSGIYKFFDSDKIIISRNKSVFKLVEQMGQAIVIDDWPEVIDYLCQYPNITPIWFNLLNKNKHKTAKTIHSLSELIDEIN